MQIIYKDEDKEGGSKRVDLVSIIICARRISRYMKEEYIGRFGDRGSRI